MATNAVANATPVYPLGSLLRFSPDTGDVVSTGGSGRNPLPAHVVVDRIQSFAVFSLAASWGHRPRVLLGGRLLSQPGSSLLQSQQVTLILCYDGVLYDITAREGLSRTGVRREHTTCFGQEGVSRSGAGRSRGELVMGSPSLCKWGIMTALCLLQSRSVSLIFLSF